MFFYMKQLFACLLMIGLAYTVGPARADEDVHSTPKNSQTTIQAASKSAQLADQSNAPSKGGLTKIPCTCRFKGRSHALGTVACIRTARGNRVLARCQMSLNNTTWKFSDEPCDVDPTS